MNIYICIYIYILIYIYIRIDTYTDVSPKAGGLIIPDGVEVLKLNLQLYLGPHATTTPQGDRSR